jgi:hypothetical protein
MADLAGVPLRIVLNRAVFRSRPAGEAVTELRKRGRLLWPPVHLRVAVVAAMGAGRTALETEPGGAAATSGIVAHAVGLDSVICPLGPILEVVRPEMFAVYQLRQNRRDRILRGQAAARAASIRFGRPPIPVTKVEKAKAGLAAGKGVREVARLAGISAASVSRLKNGVLLLPTPAS